MEEIKKINRKQLEKLKEDLQTAKIYLAVVLSDKKNRKEISEKTGIEYSNLSAYAKAEKKMSDQKVLEILNAWIE